MASARPESESARTVASRLIAGGIAGCAAKTVTAPLDRLKILLQAHHKQYANTTIFQGLIRIYRNEGFQGYYKGNGAQMLRVFPYAAVQFFAHDRYSKFLPYLAGQQSEVLRFMSGSLAGVTAVTMTYPLDLVRARLAFQVNTKYYHGIADCMRTIWTQEGPRGFYRGFVPTILGMIPYAGVSFFVFGSIKRHLLQFSSLRKDENRLYSPVVMVAGAVAGITAQSLSYPLDVVRRRMQIDRFNKTQYRSTLSTMMHIYHESGIIKGLFRGLSLNWIREVPQVAVAFTVHELMKDAFGLHDPHLSAHA